MAELSDSESLLPPMWQLSRSFSEPDVTSKHDSAKALICARSCTGLQFVCNSSNYRFGASFHSQLEKQCAVNAGQKKVNILELMTTELNTGKSHAESQQLQQDANESGICKVHLRSTLPTQRRCHCRACCSCSPVDRLRGMCPDTQLSSNIHSRWRSASIDSGLQRFSIVNPMCSTHHPCRKSDVAANSVKFRCQETFDLIPSAVSTCVTVFPHNSVATCSSSTAISDDCQSSAEDDSDGHDVFLPKTPSFIKSSVSALEFRQKFEHIQSWFRDFSDDQRNVLLRDLLEQCRLPQMHLLSVFMAPRMHAGCAPNCEDRLAQMPEIVSLKILSLLDPVSLCRSSLVCRHWYRLANEPMLWRRLCRLSKWGLSRSAERKQYVRFKNAAGCDWKGMFAERFRLRNNWLKGRCHVRTFEGHLQGVSCVQFDDTRIVSGSSDKTIRLWNIRTNSPWAAQTLVGHSGTVRCLHLEGNRLVSGSSDCMIKVWDLSAEASWTSVACKVTMVGHTDIVRCLQVDDEKVISGSYDTTLKIWDLKTGHCRRTLRGHEAAVLCVQFDHEKIISGSCDKSIKVWTFEGACIVTLQGHQDAVTCLQFDRTRIITGSLDRTLRFWDIGSWRCVNVIDWKASEGHTGVIRCLQADSWRVVSASDDRTIKVWSLETGKRLVTLRNHTDGVTCLQFNDSVIVSGSYDKTVKLWDFSCC